MSLFQKSVEKKYLNGLDAVLIEKKYAGFQHYFGNPEIQENIRNLREEEFQSEFIRELFVNILGYTLKPNPDYNIVLEKKNVDDSKKADGAILRPVAEHAPLQVAAVIELKSTHTTDLNSIETQAFGYKNHHPDCVYVITSNFEKLRFYIQNAVDHIDFDLFNLSKEQFSLLWLCLAKENLLNDLPLKIKDSSVLQEENITKKLYADYSTFRKAIFKNLVKNNPGTGKLLLFKKTQKLLDRFLFILFAEDRLLVPPNSITQIIEKWKDDMDFGDPKPLYAIFKKYFHVLNVGRPKSGKRQEIFAYNGGLFQPDKLLDSVAIDDDILQEHTLKLSNYNFETDVDVNILGHIFEHSLGEIENVQAEIKGEKIDTKKNKRKKDGIFYTPKYITKYIVENTLGKLCEEKKAEMGILDFNYEKNFKLKKARYLEVEKRVKTPKGIEVVIETKKTNISVEGTTQLKKTGDYRNWLLGITICDPACGSGAFLNQTLEFLIAEHRKIDELRAQLLGGAIVFSDITTDILEKNIFGVDINEESVDIAKLSLWLRTAQKGRKLNTLSNNIKCGNSLIDDPEVAGEKAFYWQKEFPDIFHRKKKKTWHITTATHNSRYSQRMFDNYVKKGEPVWLSEKEEIIVTRTIEEIAEKDKLNIIAYNICGDHIHLLLACEEEELPGIVQKIKSMSARACNIAMGRTVPMAKGEHAPHTEHTDTATSEHAPQKRTDIPATQEYAPAHFAGIPQKDGEHAPRKKRGQTQHHLWTKKFGQKKINAREQLNNTIKYIQNNRKKHQLPENKELQALIDKMTCTPQHAFRTEYKGGFDVVIGNPPYGAHFREDEKNFITNHFKSYQYKFESYLYFYEKGIQILKTNGLLSFITPELFLRLEKSENIRKYLYENAILKELKFFGENVFSDVKVNSVVLTLTLNSEKRNNEFRIVTEKNDSWQYGFKRWGLTPLFKIEYEISPNDEKIISKVLNNSTNLGSIGESIQGITPYDSYRGQSKELIKSRAFHFAEKIDKTCEKWLDGKNVNRYQLTEGDEWLRYGDWLAAPRDKSFFQGARLLFREVPGQNRRIQTTYAEQPYYHGHSITSFKLNETEKSNAIFTILGVVNSNLISWFAKFKLSNFSKRTFPKLNPKDIKQLPIHKEFRLTKFPIENMLELNKQLHQKKNKFLNRIKDNLELEKNSKKLDAFYNHDFKTFIAELKKQKLKLSLVQQDEWEEYFNVYKTEINNLQAEIGKTDKEIDRMVYELYGLTEEEIEIVEEANT